MRVNRLDRRQGLPVLGIMSGTSLDGVDCVLTAFDRMGRPRWVRGWAKRFPAGLRVRLLACASGESSAWEGGALHHELGRFYARVAVEGLRGERVQLVGLHGQTVFHRGGGRSPATLQIGESAYLAEVLRVPVVSNFRAADMAAGGQGAPLATLFHLRVFAEKGRHICVQNIGGIGNVTSIDWRFGRRPRVLAFDTGPGNMLMDEAVRRLTGGRRGFDAGGRWAAAGSANEALLKEWLRHPFFARRPPKSTGREMFGGHFFEACNAEMETLRMDGPGRVATLTEFTARSIAENYVRHLPSLPSRVVVCGGGARNPVLMERLAQALRGMAPGVEVTGCQAAGWPPEGVEGGAFALLARERWLGRPGNVPETTGATRAVLCGQITEP